VRRKLGHRRRTASARVTAAKPASHAADIAPPPLLLPLLLPPVPPLLGAADTVNVCSLTPCTPLLSVTVRRMLNCPVPEGVRTGLASTLCALPSAKPETIPPPSISVHCQALIDRPLAATVVAPDSVTARPAYGPASTVMCTVGELFAAAYTAR
jgi:hypothetical protein